MRTAGNRSGQKRKMARGRFSYRNAAACAVCEALESRILLAATPILTYHVDNQSTGFNGTEVLLTPGDVTASQFGKKFSTTLDGQVFAEPLYVPNVTITSGSSQGVHNVVYVATQHDTLYAIDSGSGAILWSTSFLNTANATINPMGATAMTSVPNGDVGSTDISPEIGITATPVIDQANGLIYVVAKTKETISGVTTNYVQILFKVSIQSGSAIAGAVLGDTINNAGAYTYVTTGAAAGTPYALGTGDGTVTVNGKATVYFNALREMGRPGITLYNGTIYMAFASHGDQAPYHGWVLAYDASTLAIKGALNATPNGSDGGIWDGAGSMGVDASGNLYFITGNGSFNEASTNFGTGFTGLPKDADYGDCFVKISVDSLVTTQAGVDITKNANGWGLKVVDFFSPYANAHNGDEDLGSGGVTLLPDAVGSAAHAHLLIGGGKGGVLYLVDRDNMGGFEGNPATDRMVQEIAGAFNGKGLYNAAAFFFNNPTPATGSPSGLIEVEGSGDSIRSYTISNGVITTTPTSVTAVAFGGLSGSPSVSANGTTNGIVWAINRGNSALYAYQADNLAVNLFNSTQTGPNNLNNTLGGSTKFSVPTVADGLVFVGIGGTNGGVGTGSLVVFGLLAPPAGPPAAPSNIAATAPAFNTVNVTWTDNATNEDSYLIERTTNINDPNSWVQIGTASTNATTYSDSTAAANTTYYYRVRAYNSYNGGSYSSYSTLTAGVTTPAPPPQGAGDGAFAQFWNLTNGVAIPPQPPFSGSPVLTRVDPTIDFTWGSGSPGTGVNTDYFGSEWTGRILAEYSETYTFSFTVNDGVVFNIKPVASSTYTNLVNHWTNGGNFTTTATFAMSAGQYYDFQMYQYEATNTAQAHLSWSSPSTPSQVIPQLQLYSGAAPAAPTNLVLAPQASYEVDLTWADNSNIETGYEVQREDPGGSFATIATLPPNSTSYNDTQLFADVAYTYRVRALNFAADSGFSNSATVQTPVPPAAPTNAHVTGVTANPASISMAWIDNSIQENGYHVLRAPPLIAPNTDLQYQDAAYLPANTTTYTDSSPLLAAGTEYYYHIVAYNLGGSSVGSDFTIETLTDAPTGLATSGGGSQVTLNWTAPAFNSNSMSDLKFNVYRTTHADGTSLQQIATNLASPTYNDTTTTAGVTYYYTVTAVDLGGESARSNLVVGNLPAAPSGLAVGTATQTTVPLSWTDNATSEGGFHIYRSLDGSTNWTLVSTVAAHGGTGTVNSSDSTGAAGTRYYYQITAFNTGGGDSGNSNAANTWTLSNVPTGLSATAVSPTQLNVSWSETGAAASYNIYRAPDVSGAPRAFTLAGNSVAAAFSDTGAAAGTKYWYEITAINGGGAASGNSSQSSGLTYPGAPAGFSAADTTTTHISLTWNALSGVVNGYNVYRGTAPGGEGATPLNGGTPIVGTTYDDTSAVAGIAYYYTVVAVNGTGSGGASVESSATLFPTAYSGNDDYTVRLSSNGQNLQVWVGDFTGQATYSIIGSAVSALSFSAGTLTLDGTYGDPLVSGGISFSGVTGANTIRIVGHSTADAFTVNPTSITHNGLTIGVLNVQTFELATGAYSVPADLGGPSVIVDGGATVGFAGSQTLGMLRIAAGGLAQLAPSGSSVLALSGLSIAGKLDLGNNNLFFQSTSANLTSDYNNLFGLLASGRDGGAWDGSGIAATSAGANHGLALALAAQLPVMPGTFFGQTPNATAILVRCTWEGDANLDGQIDLRDYRRVDAGYVMGGMLSGYVWGDFTYGGATTAADYAIIDASLQAQGSSLADGMVVLHASEFGTSYAAALAALLPPPAPVTVVETPAPVVQSPPEPAPVIVVEPVPTSTTPPVSAPQSPAYSGTVPVSPPETESMPTVVGPAPLPAAAVVPPARLPWIHLLPQSAAFWTTLQTAADTTAPISQDFTEDHHADDPYGNTGAAWYSRSRKPASAIADNDKRPQARRLP